MGNESRCDTCVSARIIQGYAESERIVFCDATYPTARIPFKVMQCSMYEDRRLPDFENMKAIAWQIRTKSAGNIAGFVTVPDESEELPEPEEAPESAPEEVPAAAARSK